MPPNRGPAAWGGGCECASSQGMANNETPSQTDEGPFLGGEGSGKQEGAISLGGGSGFVGGGG